MKCSYETGGTAALQKLFQKETDVAGCADLMDEYRIAAARRLGTERF